MFFSSDAIKIYFCSRPTDMRMSFDGLYGVAKSFMGHDPMSGALFVFRNKRGNCLKILLWDRYGFVIWYKRLPKGTFRFPPIISGNSIDIDYATLMMILEGIDMKTARRQKRFQYRKSPLKIDPVSPTAAC
jgi:transposase